jgi:hypothetical protein
MTLIRLPAGKPAWFDFVAPMLMAIVASLVIGCSATPFREEQRIALPADAPYESVVKNTDYSMEYELIYRPAESSGSGTLLFRGRLVPRRGLDSMTIWINFLDAEGKTIASNTVYSPGAGRGAARSNLEQNFEVPPGTNSVAFTHNAREKRPILLD